MEEKTLVTLHPHFINGIDFSDHLLVARGIQIARAYETFRFRWQYFREFLDESIFRLEIAASENRGRFRQRTIIPELSLQSNQSFVGNCFSLCG